MKHHNLVREFRLICKKHKCLFRDCSCEKRDWETGNHDWVLFNEEELERFFKTGELKE